MKKVSLLMAAFALVLGFSQCSKKPVMPSYSGPVGDMILQDITLSATRGNGGGDSKVSVVDNNLQWDKEDVITVLDEDKTELGELHFVEYGKKDGVEDKTSAVFESRGSILCPKEGKLTFTVGTVGKEGNFQNQTGEGKSLYLTGEATCDGTGSYSAEMKADGYALLKLDMSAFVSVGTKDKAIPMTIESGEDVVSVTDIADISKSVYVAVPAPVKERFYTITCNENKAVKNWKALEENTFYTKEGAAGEAIVIELPKKEIPVAEPKGEPAATGVSLKYNIKDDPLPIEDGVVYSEYKDMSESKTAKYPAPGKGEQEHTVTLTGLTAGTTYYVRVYAKYNGSGSQETVYGEQTDFTTDIVPTTPKFTVGMDGDKPITVEFAPGNLWYGTEDDAKPVAKAFHFEANQWSFASTWDESHVSHFFWSKTASVAYAASYSDGSAASGDVFFTNDPENETKPNENFQVSGETKGTWRTLSNDEWAYLLNTSGSSGRNDANRFAKALVNGVKGLLVFPDGYALPSDYTTADGGTGMAKVNKTSSADAPWPDASIPETTWTLMESAGVVFLPAAGSRSSTSVINAGSGYYWSTTSAKTNAYRMQFLSGAVSTGNTKPRSDGYPVRLVRDVK